MIAGYVLLVISLIALMTLGPIAIIGNLSINVTGGLWKCPYPLPFIMCNMCQMLCTFGQIRIWLFYGILGTNFLIGRVFCGLLCPGGILQDMLFRIPTKKLIMPRRLDLILRYTKYGVTILVIGLVIHATNLWSQIPLVAELWSFMIKYYEKVRIGVISTAALVLIFAIFFSRGWCRYLCPLGTWIAVFNKYSLLRVRRRSEKCVVCHHCRERCLAGLNPLSNQEAWSSLECVRCMQCYTGCKTGALEIGLWR